MHVVRSVWPAVVAAVAVVSSWAVFAQSSPERELRERRQTVPDLLKPRVLTGSDIGFRIEGTEPRTGNPMGTWVVKVNGDWVEAASRPLLRPAQ